MGCSCTAKWVLRALMSAEVRADDTDDTSPRSDLPHRLTEDNLYKGMLIPKGSLVFGNIWSA